MKQLNATDAKREFGELLITVQSEPVIINKNGKSVAVMLSDKEFHVLEAFKEQALKQAIIDGVKDISHGRIKEHEEVFGRLKMKINDSL